MENTVAIPNTIKCKYCGRDYKSKNYYNRHVLVCEILSKTDKERAQEEEELSDTPNHRKMYELLLEMTLKYSKMEKKLEELSKWTETKKSKIHVIDWLNINYKSATKFIDFCNNLKLNYSHLELIFNSNFVPGIISIFQQFIPLTNGNEAILPIRAFDKKDNTLFIYTDDEIWKEMTGQQFEKMIGIISKEIIREFGKWQNENLKRIKKDEKFAITYAKNTQKVMGSQYTYEQSCAKIKRGLYKYLKMNLRNIVQYEFSF